MQSKINQINQISVMIRNQHKKWTQAKIKEKMEEEMKPEFLIQKYNLNKWEDFRMRKDKAIDEYIKVMKKKKLIKDLICLQLISKCIENVLIKVNKL